MKDKAKKVVQVIERIQLIPGACIDGSIGQGREVVYK